MPMIVRSGATPQAAGKKFAKPRVFIPELVPRNCTPKPYKKKPVPTFTVSSEIVAYTSPDSTFAATKRLIDGAKTSIIIGIYDFTAHHVKQLVLNAMARGVKVELMLDIDGKAELDLFKDLEKLGADCTPAPACSSKRNKFFRSSHEKVIVIDNEWSIVQSGNYSNNSIPLNTIDGGDRKHFVSGNRDTGLAVRSKPLAKFFRKILESDIALELSGAQAAAALAVVADTFLIEAAPTKVPKTLFPSKTFSLTAPLTIQPVLSPDNYMAFVPTQLTSAKRSILIQQQYIRAKQSDIVTLLSSIAAARKKNPKLGVRILLGKVFSTKDLPKERANLKELATKFNLKIGTHIRYVDTTKFVHCHNKLVLLDSDEVFVSSQNWSNAAVSENREAGLWFRHRGIANYFRAIFEDDWATGFKTLSAGPEVVGPESVKRGNFVRVDAGDFAEV